MRHFYKKIAWLLVLAAAAQGHFFVPQAAAATLVRPPNNIGLAAYWSFNEGGGNKAGDSSGNNVTGNVAGSALWADGKVGTALYFNGSSDYIDFGSPDALKITGDQTISMWLKPEVLGDSVRRNPYAKAFGGEGTITQEPNGTLNYYYGTAGSNNSPYQGFTMTSSIQENQWVHLVLVRDLGSMKLRWYKNGVMTNESNANYASATAGSLSAYVGAGYVSRYKGHIDEVRIYNRALSAADIEALYRSGTVLVSNPGKKNLVGYWSFNDGSGAVVTDFSDNRNAGTVYNANWVDGKRGRALSFNGSNAYVQINSVPNVSGSGHTLSLWINPSDNGTRVVFSKNNWCSDGGFRILRLGDNSFQYSYTYGSSNNSHPGLSGNTPVGKWTHIAVVQDNVGLKATMYINGQYVSEASINAGFYDAANYVRFGSGDSGCGQPNYFYGQIDDGRLYNRALTADEIKGIYRSGELTLGQTANRIASGLVGYWTFNGSDMNSAAANDLSGLQRSASLFNGPKPAIGKIGQALEFNGTDSYARASGFSELGTSNQPYTFTGWVRVSSGAGDGNIIHMSSISNGTGWCLPPMAYSGGKLRGHSWAGTGVSVLGTTVLQQGEWYHFANTWDAANGLRIYVNGVLENTTAQASYTASGTSNFIFAGFSPGSCSGNLGFFKGALDDLRVYSRSLTGQEIQQLYNSGR